MHIPVCAIQFQAQQMICNTVQQDGIKASGNGFTDNNKQINKPTERLHMDPHSHAQMLFQFQQI